MTRVRASERRYQPAISKMSRQRFLVAGPIQATVKKVMQVDSVSRELVKLASVLFGAGIPPRRVLVAEGESVHRLMIGRLLERLGHEAHLALDEDHAIRLFESRAFDLVLADVRWRRFLEVARGSAFAASLVLMGESEGKDFRVLERPLTVRKLIGCLEEAERARSDNQP
ncbi:MAG: hypothetical protein NZV14_02520 [Bryobacteraceae bacterium]|nr:hypothetical protein [Bryobacteraceae bacterium]MDW8377006.1 hypothetical protein [Bryobacterales bacterium]